MIDFKNMEAMEITGFRGGEGVVFVKMFRDENTAIARLTITPGAVIGYHIHEADSETIMVVEGTLEFCLDGETETLSAGEVHYCPKGHYHSVTNKTDKDASIFAVIPKHPL